MRKLLLLLCTLASISFAMDYDGMMTLRYTTDANWETYEKVDYYQDFWVPQERIPANSAVMWAQDECCWRAYNGFSGSSCTMTIQQCNSVYAQAGLLVMFSGSAFPIKPSSVQASNYFQSDAHRLFTHLYWETEECGLLPGCVPNHNTVTASYNILWFYKNMATTQPVLLSEGIIAEASSQESGYLGAAKAVDSRLDTRWGSAFTDEEYLIADLGNEQWITDVIINWENASAKQYRLLVSTDKINWVIAKEIIDGKVGAREDAIKVNYKGRYVKMRGIKRNTSYGYSIKEMTVYGYRVNGNALSGVITNPISTKAVASSTEGPFVASNAVDANPDTRWASGWTDFESITLDLGRIFNIDEVILSWERAYGKQYFIETSLDNIKWTRIYGESNGDGNIDAISNLNSIGRYIRMKGEKRGTAYGYSLYDFQVRGR